MKYYGLSSGGKRAINLPPLAGGINYRDGENIADNQLSDALNVWYKDGILKTRPGSSTGESFIKTVTNGGLKQKIIKVKPFPDIIRDGDTLISLAVLDYLPSGRW